MDAEIRTGSNDFQSNFQSLTAPRKGYGVPSLAPENARKLLMPEDVEDFAKSREYTEFMKALDGVETLEGLQHLLGEHFEIISRDLETIERNGAGFPTPSAREFINQWNDSGWEPRNGYRHPDQWAALRKLLELRGSTSTG